MLYLIRLDKPLGNERHKAMYYLGFCAEDRVLQRLDEHRAGNGARMLAAANERGIHYQIVATWLGGTRKLERKFKNRHCHARLLRASAAWHEQASRGPPPGSYSFTR